MRIGIDLGGTKIEAVALSPAGEEIARRRVTTPHDYAASLDAIAGLVRELDRAADDTGTVGVGIPGTVVPQTGLVKNANSVWLNGRPLGRDLEERLDRPVRLMNWLGADEWPGPPCYCGKRGCVETWLSGPALERDHAEHTGLTLPAREIARAAVDGDPGAAATLARYHDRLGRALASLINVLDPDVVVLGGGMSNIAGLPEAAYAAVPRYLFAAGASAVPVATRVVRAAHGDSSGVRGAAWLWPASA
ncbi:MAG: hypothetical protein DMD56_13170 [Gemmatimonadetes bacterium]|nr:MAG: hypothetical protein DMD56_13170 [Gemmatimonadota bacterium]